MSITQSIERGAFSLAIDGVLKHINKDREKGLLQLPMREQRR